MASVKDKNLGLNLGWQFGETPWNTGMDTNMVVLGSMANLTVKSATTKAEPFGNDGDVYFIPVGATGSNWSGKANHIAIYSGESTYSTTNVARVIGWVFIPVRQGWTFTVQDQGNRLVTWDALLGLTDTVNVSTFLTAASSYTATGNVTFSGSVKFSGTHSADTTELATLGYVNSAISSQDFSNYAKLDASQTFTGNVVFSEEVQGKLATQPTSLATLKNVTDAISGITLENTGEGFGIAEINTNGNLTFKKLRSTDSTVSIVDTPEGLNLTVAMPVSVQEFTDLLDAPSSYVGAANQYVKVNTDASGLEFSEGFDEKFISLSDVPSSYIGSEGKYLVVDGGKVAFKALPSFSTAFKFTELTDTPNLIATSAVGRHNLLRGSRTSPAKLEFTGDLLLPQKSTELPQMPSVLEAGKYLRVKGDNSGYELVSGTGGGGSDSSTTIKGTWTPSVTGTPALTKMQREGAVTMPMYDYSIDKVVFTDNSVSTSENGEGGMSISSTPFDLSSSTEDRFVVYMKYEGSETTDSVYYGLYSGLGAIFNVGGEDSTFSLSPFVYYESDMGLVKEVENGQEILYADWNPHEDSVAHVLDFDRRMVEFWSSRNNGTKVIEQPFAEIEQLLSDSLGTVITVDKYLVTHAVLNTYFVVEDGEDTRLVESGKMSAAKTFDVSPSAVDVFDITQVVDLTPPENAANNAFILNVANPVFIPELGKELVNGDIVFFDENKTPIRYIPKEFAEDAPIKVWQPTLQPSQYLFENAVDIGYGSAPVISNGGKTAIGVGAALSTTLEEFLSYDYEAGIAFTADLTSAGDSPVPFGVWLGDSADISILDFMTGAQVVRENGSLFVFVSYGSPQEIPPTATQFLLTVQRISGDVFVRLYTDVAPSTPLIQTSLYIPEVNLEAFAYYSLLPSTVTLLSKNETSFDYVDITDAGLGIDETDLPTQPNGNLYELSLAQDVRLTSLGRVVKDKDVVAFGQNGQPIQVIQEVGIPNLSGYAKKSELADVATSGKAADIDNSEGTFAEPSDLADFLTKTDWSAMPTLSSSDNVLTQTKGVYKAYSNNPPQNFPSVTAGIGIPVLVVVHADPYYDSYLGRNIESITIYATDIWQRIVMTGWVKIYPAVIPDQQQADLAESDSSLPTYVNNVIAAREQISARIYGLPNGELSNFIPEIGAVFVDNSYSTSARTLTWNITSLPDAVSRGYQSLIITKDRSDITLIVNRTDTSAQLFNAKLDTNAVYIVSAILSMTSGGGNFGVAVEKISNVPKAGQTSFNPKRLTSSNNLNAISDSGWYIFSSDDVPVNCFSTAGWTSDPVDILLEVYEGAMLDTGISPPYFPTIVQEVREGSGYFANIRSTTNPTKTGWGAWAVPTGNGIEDAPSDGKKYARKDGEWVKVANKPQTIEVVTANKTLTAADNNKILLISADGITITLPAAVPNFTVDIVKMDEDFITVVATNGTDKYREDTTTITVVKDVTIFSTEVVGKEYVAIGAYEV